MAMTERDRISQFDGLRALAFTAVFLHHGVHAPLLWMGVDQFFVLSGFLITRNLLQLRRDSTTSSSLAAFYYRRVLRIVPAYYVALILIAIFQTLTASDAPWFFGFASNIHDAIHPPAAGALSSMWSIAVEEQFYLVWPWLVLFVPTRWLRPTFLAVIVAAPLCRVAASSLGYEAVYRLMPCRMDLLAFGALLATIDETDVGWFVRHRAKLILTALAALAVFAALSLGVHTFRTSSNTLLFDVVGFGLSAIFFTVILAYVRGLSEGPVYKFLMLPPLRYLGKISYMAYLVHMLGLAFAMKLHRGVVPTAVVGFILTIAMASISWYLMEQPLTRLRGAVRPKPTPPPTPSER
jgi:peptidoglycan/LPS O-acetylase OafA/YrhL